MSDACMSMSTRIQHRFHDTTTKFNTIAANTRLIAMIGIVVTAVAGYFLNPLFLGGTIVCGLVAFVAYEAAGITKECLTKGKIHPLWKEVDTYLDKEPESTILIDPSSQRAADIILKIIHECCGNTVVGGKVEMMLKDRLIGRVIFDNKAYLFPFTFLEDVVN